MTNNITNNVNGQNYIPTEGTVQNKPGVHTTNAAGSLDPTRGVDLPPRTSIVKAKIEKDELAFPQLSLGEALEALKGIEGKLTPEQLAKFIGTNQARLEVLQMILTELEASGLPKEEMQETKVALLRLTLDGMALDVAKVRDQETMEQVQKLVEAGNLDKADAVLKQYLSKELAGLDKEAIKTAGLDKPMSLKGLLGENAMVDISVLIIELMSKIDEVRKQTMEIRAFETNTNLKIKQEAVAAIIKKGEEQYKKEWWGAMAGIISGMVTIVGTGVTLGVAAWNGKANILPGDAARLTMRKQEQAIREFQRVMDIGNAFVNGISSLTKGGFDLGAAAKNKDIAKYEALVQELNAYASNSDDRRQTMREQGNELMQLITKQIDAMTQIQKSLNDAVATASRV